MLKDGLKWLVSNFQVLELEFPRLLLLEPFRARWDRVQFFDVLVLGYEPWAPTADRYDMGL